jgi:periplasmic mercuric ion binding protein
MKMKTLLIMLGLLLTGSFAWAQSKEIIIQTTAQCGECKEIIEKALMAEKGVRYASLDVKSKQAKVVYNGKRTSPERLRSAISAVGYDADEIPADPEAVKKLNPCCTKDGHKDHD